MFKTSCNHHHSHAVASLTSTSWVLAENDWNENKKLVGVDSFCSA